MPDAGRVQRKGGERLKHWLRKFLHTDDTPSRAALAFAVGVFIGCTPALGFHTLLALGVAFLFGLNRVAMVTGTLVNNPWTFVPIYSSAAWLGSLLTGTNADVPRLHEPTSWESFGSFVDQIRPWIVPMTTGTLVLGALCALLSFPIILYAIRWYRSLRHAG